MIDPKAFGPQRRWYDEIPNLAQAIHISQALPQDVQAVIARCLNEAIEEHRKNRRADKHAYSLGGRRVLGLYRASYRRRWYDPNPLTHRAFNLMSSMPDSYLEALAARILKAAQHVEQQKKSLSWYHDESVWAGEVRGILQQGQLAMSQREGGLRLGPHFRRGGHF
jgi:hypothetical protein